MAGFARLVYRALTAPDRCLQDALIRQLLLASAAALFVFLLSLTRGLDLSPGLF